LRSSEEDPATHAETIGDEDGPGAAGGEEEVAAAAAGGEEEEREVAEAMGIEVVDFVRAPIPMHRPPPRGGPGLEEGGELARGREVGTSNATPFASVAPSVAHTPFASAAPSRMESRSTSLAPSHQLSANREELPPASPATTTPTSAPIPRPAGWPGGSPPSLSPPLASSVGTESLAARNKVL
jgi:hypothetical protein